MDGEWASEFAVETTGLTKRFGKRTVVDHVDLRVPHGSAFGYLGPNGAGKTTTIRMLLGLIAADDGGMRLLGRPVPAERAAALVRVGAIVEEPKFFDYLTGRENLRVIAAAREPEAHDRIDCVLERVGLRDRADDRVRRYSTGMRQRLGVARCLLADPDLLILDEPTNGLDPGGIQEFRLMVRELVGEGRTVLLSSHLLDEVEKVCDTVAIVDRGRVLAQGSITELSAAGVQAVVFRVIRSGRAVALLSGHPAILSVEENGTGIRAVLGRVSLREARSVAADLNRRLVEGGVEVFDMELPRATLEERFLEITQRMQEEVPA
jgi:ABC-2 type transport system ATP-binding protein